MNIRRTAARFGALGAAGAALSLSLIAPASAHVTVGGSTTEAGEYTVLTVSVPHGCEESPTTKVEIKVPEDVLSVTPTRNPFWDVSTTVVKLAKPTKDAHGNAVTERTGTVTYTATTPLPDDQRDAFELSFQIPDKAGETLAFPTVQTCEKGKTAWVEIPAKGGDAEELEHPAPSFVITPDDEGEHGEAAEGAEEGVTGAVSKASSDQRGTIGLVAGIAGLALGATALVQVRRQK
jgi:uncharacterized protein YcnI